MIRATAAWVAETDLAAIPAGLSQEEALRGGRELLALLREGRIQPGGAVLDDAAIRVLHAACRLLAEAPEEDLDNALQAARPLFDFILAAAWPEPDFDERSEVLCDCAFAAWRAARRKGKPAEENAWRREFGAAAASSPLGSKVNAFLAAPLADRVRLAEEFQIEDPEFLLCVCEVLRSRWLTSPAIVRDDAEFFHSFLEKPSREIGLFDEQEYLLGELALIAGTMCRNLARREEAHRWFDRAESRWIRMRNSAGNLLKLRYQRLALQTEECEFATVLQLLPQVISGFQKLGLREDVLKSRSLQAVIWKETDRTAEALGALGQIAEEAKALRSEALLASACVSLSQIHALLGQVEEAIARANEATPILQRLENHIDLAKLQWGIGHLLRAKGKATDAIEAFRISQKKFAEIGLRAHVAGVHLVLADLFLDVGQERQAEEEIRAALPIIDEEKMVPEGLAALSLLRESLRRRQIDRNALRDLHGYFKESD